MVVFPYCHVSFRGSKPLGKPWNRNQHCTCWSFGMIWILKRGLFKGGFSLWELRGPAKTKQEISNRTHWMEPSTWVSNSSSTLLRGSLFNFWWKTASLFKPLKVGLKKKPTERQNLWSSFFISGRAVSFKRVLYQNNTNAKTVAENVWEAILHTYIYI